MIDLLPTPLELAGAEQHHTHFGRSLLPLLEDRTTAHRDAVFCEGGFRIEDEHLLEVSPWIYEPKGRLQHEQPELDWLLETGDVIPWTPDPRKPDVVDGWR